MNKILVTNNKICCDCDKVIVGSNKLTFSGNGEYSICYEESSYVDLEIEIRDGCYIKLVEFSCNDEMVMKRRYVLNERSTLVLFKFYYHREIKEDVKVELNGKYSKLDYHFSNLCYGKEEYVYDICHNCSDSDSNIINRSIARDGKVDFTINSYLPLENKNCVLNQDTKIINLGDNYSVIRPNMYICDSNVEAKHGSVIGRFSDDELFYLMSRGISLEESKKLLVRSYIFSNMLIDLEFREKILEIVALYWR